MSKLFFRCNRVPKNVPEFPFWRALNQFPKVRRGALNFKFNFPSREKIASRAHALWHSVRWGANFAFGKLVRIQFTILNFVQCCKVGLVWHVYALLTIKVSALPTPSYSSETCWGCFSIFAHTCATIVSCFMYFVHLVDSSLACIHHSADLLRSSTQHYSVESNNVVWLEAA